MKPLDLRVPCRALGIALLAAGAQGCVDSTSAESGRDGGPGATDAGTPDVGTPADGATSPPDGGGGGSSCAASPAIHGNLRPLWSKALGAGYLAAVATDPSNDVVVVGSALGSITVNDQTFPVAGTAAGNSPFLLKLDPSGQMLWHREFGAEANVQAAAVDASGNIVVAGDVGAFSTSPADLGTGPLAPSSLFVAKFDPQGKTLWVDAPTCDAQSQLSLAVDGTGNVALAAEAQIATCFGAAPIDAGSPAGSYQSFVTLFDGGGHVTFSKILSNDVPGSIVQFDGSGNLFVAGQTNANPNVAPRAGAASTAKLDPSGNVLWQVADGTYASATAVASGASGPIVAGTFGGTIGLNQPAAAHGPADLFLVGLGESGAATFEKSFPAAGLTVDALVNDPTGGVVATGRLSSYADFGQGLLAPPGIVVAKFDASGAVLSSASFAVAPYTGLPPERPTLAVDTAGNVVLGGSFYGAADFGTGILLSAVPDPHDLSPTLFVARYAQEPATPGAPRSACPVPATDAGVPEGGLLTAMAPSTAGDMALSSDTVYWTTGSEVMSAPIAGGAPRPVAIAQSNAGSLVLDSNILYWTNSGSASGAPATGSVVSLPLDGGTVTTLAAGQDEPGALAVDGTSLYFVAGGTTAVDGGASAVSVLSLPRAGGAPAPVVTGLSTRGPIAASEGEIAYANALPTMNSTLTTSQIVIVPATGGLTTTLATSDHLVTSIALDAANVYWLDASTSGIDTTAADGRVRSVPRAGGAAITLADNQAAPGKLVLLGSTLFWSASGNWANVTPAGNAGVWSLPVGGGTPSGLVTGRLGVQTFAVDGSHLAWFDLLDGDKELVGLFVKSR